MKIVQILLLCSTFIFSDTVDVNPIVKKIDAIKESKKSPTTLDYNIYDPFAKAKPLLAKKEQKPVVKTARPIRVQTILNGKALIDGKWHGVGSSVHDATIKTVANNHIVIIRDSKLITITIKSKKNIIKTKERSR
ncbi:MAG: hypothetical protein U9P71_05470 [Campylobacterota bacterium]|nr:hypothetical protein [Campylobacterota bacterium]